MDQERIGKTIKELRTKNNLSQKEFADKYNVTYQAVSKWENGKNIPDLSILKRICSDNNITIEELLEGKTQEKQTNKIIPIIITILLTTSLIIGVTLIISHNNNETFEFKTLSSNSKEFKLTGSIAYNKDKTSIFITDVSYIGEDKNIEYKSIKSTLYEIEGKTKKEIGTYNKTFLITLESFLTGMTYNIDNHASICKEYTEESLLIEILAINKQDKTIKYEIPITISENCQK
jgi:transcriptional regulator with XRE-family HTH domain